MQNLFYETKIKCVDSESELDFIESLLEENDNDPEITKILNE